MEPASSVLEQLVTQIVNTVRPLRIVLFGSAARGDMGPDSDIDILVVMPNSTHRRTAQQLYQQVKGIGVPFDVIVATPADLEHHQDNPGLIYDTIVRGQGHLHRLTRRITGAPPTGSALRAPTWPWHGCRCHPKAGMTRSALTPSKQRNLG